MRKARPLAALLLGIGLGDCAHPAIEGGQIRDPPDGFGYDPGCTAYSGPVFNLTVERQRCWFTRGDPPSSIVMSELRGVASRADLARHLEAESQRHTRLAFEPVETLRIDGHPAWGWYQNVVSAGQVSGIGYVAVIPYGGATYVVEFSGRRAQDLDRSRAKSAVTSFAVVRSWQLDRWKLLVAVLGLVAGYFVIRRVRHAESQRPPPPAGPPTLRERAGSSPGQALPKDR